MKSTDIKNIHFSGGRLYINGSEITGDVFIELDKEEIVPETLGINVSESMKTRDVFGSTRNK